MTKLPYKASAYIHHRFRDGFLTTTKAIKNKRGSTFFLVDLSKDDRIYHLTFNEKGTLTSQSIDPAYDDDYFEGAFYGEDDPPFQ